MDKKSDTYSIVSTLTSTKYLIGLMFTLHGSLTKGFPISHIRGFCATSNTITME